MHDALAEHAPALVSHRGGQYVVSSFDRVCHDALMARVARRIEDKRVLRLVRAYLVAGVMADGALQASEEGTPQGSPLSPLLANVMLDDLDWELDRRGHRFVRYADDIRIYVGSERAGQRVLQSIGGYVERRLKLKVNRGKSAVAWAVRQPFLGFCFYRRRGEVKVRLDPEARKRAKDRIRVLTSRTWGVSMKRRITEINRFTVGWTAYFQLADTRWPFIELDGWLKTRLRQTRWKEWQRIRTRWSRLQALGLPEREAREWAMTNKGSWRAANTFLRRAMPDAYWNQQGLTGFAEPYRRLRDTTRTAGCGPARPVVWEGPG
jgi:RNA-directed DNA polymerase